MDGQRFDSHNAMQFDIASAKDWPHATASDQLLQFVTTNSAQQLRMAGWGKHVLKLFDFKFTQRIVLIVDIDVSTTEAVTFEDLDRTLDELRYVKNKVFFTYMKNADKHFK